MLAPQKLMDISLQNHFIKPVSLRKKYAEILVARAVRFYIENELDSMVINEDLYNGEDFDCSCSQEEADNNIHNPNCEFIKNPYPNLTFAEKHERNWQKENNKKIV